MTDETLTGECDGCGVRIDGAGEREGVRFDGVLLCDLCAADRAAREDAEMAAGQLDDEIDRRWEERGRPMTPKYLVDTRPALWIMAAINERA
jgi:hypothetical protein